MQGIFNARNAAMAIVGVSLVLGKSPLDIDISSLSSFTGVKRRQEVIAHNDNITVVEDFGHHPTAIRLTIESLREKYPNQKIFACFEPRSNTAKTNIMQKQFEDALNLADKVYLGYVNATKISPEKKFDTKIAAERSGGKFTAFASNKDLLNQLMLDVKSESKIVCVFFSNGSFDNIHKDFATKISKDVH